MKRLETAHTCFPIGYKTMVYKYNEGIEKEIGKTDANNECKTIKRYWYSIQDNCMKNKYQYKPKGRTPF
jgi:hypothetical protein